MPPSTRSPQPAKALLALRDIRQADLARAIGKSEHYVSRILNGRERPSTDLAEATRAARRHSLGARRWLPPGVSRTLGRQPTSRAPVLLEPR